MRRLHPILLAALAVLAALALPAAAAASMNQESIFEDEYLLIERGDLSALDDMAALGADTVRSIVYWEDVVPSPTAKKRPKGFERGDVRSYPAAGWDRYDDFVRGAAARGLNVLLTPSGPIPRWASGCKGSARKVRACKPDPKLYGGFVRAVGTRYSGTYADENQGGGVLPRVDRWSLWNEPNIPGWLNPQHVRRGGQLHVAAADRYRALATAGIKALRATGHARDTILLGETAPLGRTTGAPATRPAPPVPFIRQLLCLDAGGRALRGAAARRSKCSRARKLRVSGYAHHPYTRGGSRPPLATTLPTEITVGTPSRLYRLLDQGARAGSIPRRLPVWYTEMGFQTNPPDPLLGVSLAKQATYLNQADFLAARDSRIRSVAQYKLIDEQDQASFQTGLRMFGTLKRKPAYAAYQLPIWAVRRGSRVEVYGQVRPAAPGVAEQVEIQHAARRKGPWQTVRTVTVASTTAQFLERVPARAGVWRLRWSPAAGGSARTSRVARAGKR